MKISKIPHRILSFCLMVVMLFSLTTTAIVAEDNAGQGGGGTGGTQNPNNVDLWDDSKQGYRVTILSENGSRVIHSSKDFVFTEPKKNKTVKSYYTNKLGNSRTNGNWEIIINDMPKAIKVVGNSYQANGDELKEWFTKGNDGVEHISSFIPDNFGGVAFWNECVKQNHKILIEPIIWYEPRISGTKTPTGIGYTVYGTVTNIAQHNKLLSSVLGNNNGGYDQAVSNAAAPSSLVTIKADNALGVTTAGKSVQPNGVPSKGVYSCNQITDTSIGLGLHIYSRDTPPEPQDPPTPSSGYDYDFMCNNLNVQNSTIREENDFNVSATFEYQQKIDCKYCTTTCSQCNLTGKYQVLIREGYYTHYDYCNIYKKDGKCDCGGCWIPPAYETRLCHKCYVNCPHCDKGELWYKKSMKGEYATPTKSALVEILVQDATLDYTRGVEGVVKYSKRVTLSADEPITINTTLNAGENIGSKVVVARINWDGRSSEVNANNNKLETGINVVPATNLQLEYINPNAPFRTGTDVISSFMLINQDDIGALNVRPKHNLIASFKAINPRTNEIIDTSQMSQLVVPKGGTNLIYFKWQLPSTYKEENIKVECHINPTKSVNETVYEDDICTGTNRVQIFKEHIPPDTVFENKPSYFIKPTGLEQTPTMQFADTVMTSINYERWEWSNDYIKRQYNMSLSAEYILQPDSKSPSHTKRLDTWSMRSGYGVDINIKANINSNLSTSAFTDVQNGNAYLPEYRFRTYMDKYRTLEVTVNNILNFPKNENTITNKGIKDYKRIHFIPLWYPDGEYVIKTYIYDCWSPVGMLSITGDINQIQIKGNAYDDWYLSHAKKVE